jgi:hypothetical protein
MLTDTLHIFLYTDILADAGHLQEVSASDYVDTVKPIALSS